MKLKRAVFLQKICFVFIYLIILPFGLLGVLFEQLTKPFHWILVEADYLQWKIGNKLLRESDKVKDGTIKNKSFIKTKTAVSAYAELKRENLLYGNR